MSLLMATLYTEQDSNVRKTWLLMGGMFLLIVVVGAALSYYFGSPDILLIATILSVVMNIAAYWFSDQIALSLAHARQVVDAAEFPDYWRSMENLCITAGLPMPKLYVIDTPVPNAFATGRDPKHASVAVTSGLLGMLNKTELEGVLAHELSHIGNRDILVATVVVVLVGLLSVISQMFLRGMWHGSNRRSSNDRSGANGILMILSIAAIVLAPVAGTILQLAISRKREFLADASGALLTRYPEGLAGALEKIGAYSRAHTGGDFALKTGTSLEDDDDPSLTGSPLTNAAISHLFIASPLGADSETKVGPDGVEEKPGFFTSLFSTHPPLGERIKRLRDH